MLLASFCFILSTKSGSYSFVKRVDVQGLFVKCEFLGGKYIYPAGEIGEGNRLFRYKPSMGLIGSIESADTVFTKSELKRAGACRSSALFDSLTYSEATLADSIVKEHRVLRKLNGDINVKGRIKGVRIILVRAHFDLCRTYSGTVTNLDFSIEGRSKLPLVFKDVHIGVIQ